MCLWEKNISDYHFSSLTVLWSEKLSICPQTFAKSHLAPSTTPQITSASFTQVSKSLDKSRVKAQKKKEKLILPCLIFQSQPHRICGEVDHSIFSYTVDGKRTVLKRLDMNHVQRFYFGVSSVAWTMWRHLKDLRPHGDHCNNHLHQTLWSKHVQG